MAWRYRRQLAVQPITNLLVELFYILLFEGPYNWQKIASLNNRVYRTLGSSIIVPKKDKIELIPTRNDYHTISVDNSIYSYRNM